MILPTYSGLSTTTRCSRTDGVLGTPGRRVLTSFDAPVYANSFFENIELDTTNRLLLGAGFGNDDMSFRDRSVTVLLWYTFRLKLTGGGCGGFGGGGGGGEDDDGGAMTAARSPADRWGMTFADGRGDAQVIRSGLEEDVTSSSQHTTAAVIVSPSSSSSPPPLSSSAQHFSWPPPSPPSLQRRASNSLSLAISSCCRLMTASRSPSCRLMCCCSRRSRDSNK